MQTQNLIDEVIALPVEKRAAVINSLLQSLNQTDEKIDSVWLDEAHRRLEEIQKGHVETIPGEEVFEKVRSKFST